MDILKKVNFVRRKITKRLTKNIGRNTTNITFNHYNTRNVKRVLIIRPNHTLGNLILLTPLLTEVSEIFPNCKIDLFVKGNLAPLLFKNYSNIDRIIQLPRKPFRNILQYLKVWSSIDERTYDVVINVDSDSSSGRIATKIAVADYKFYGEADKMQFNESPHYAKQPVYGLRNYLSQSEKLNLTKSMHDLDLKLHPTEIKEGKAILDKLVKSKNTKTICLFTSATGDKCFPESWWMELYKRLKREFADMNIIEVLPIDNISKISFNEPTFYSNNIREIGALIRNTSLFIGADSGIMHLASSVKVPSIGLFSVTDRYKYEPYNEGSLAVNTNYCSTNEIIKIITQRIDCKS
ncbi:glycosyltransferase family 9 protein [Flavobacterium sp. XS2P39]|uniref:glycosyltransferase family 9 protein n=1 Tax=Flavobacterium sp. XS2P39 TaxID=3401725 RepID=UPI003AB07E7A